MPSTARLCENENAQVYEGHGRTASAALRETLDLADQGYDGHGYVIHGAYVLPSDPPDTGFTAVLTVA